MNQPTGLITTLRNQPTGWLTTLKTGQPGVNDEWFDLHSYEPANWFDWLH